MLPNPESAASAAAAEAVSTAPQPGPKAGALEEAPSSGGGDGKTDRASTTQTEGDAPASAPPGSPLQQADNLLSHGKDRTATAMDETAGGGAATGEDEGVLEKRALERAWDLYLQVKENVSGWQ